MGEKIEGFFEEMKLDSGGFFTTDEEELVDEADDFEELFNLKVLEKQPQKRLCFCHPDCFANDDNVCMALRDTRFSGSFCGGNCPFFKTEKQYLTERKKVLQDLVNQGKGSLIYRYQKVLDDWEMEYLEEIMKKGFLGDLTGIGIELKELLAEAEESEKAAEEYEWEHDTDIPIYDDSDYFDDEE